MLKKFALLAALWWPAMAFAQSTAGHVVVGAESTSGCPGSATVCWSPNSLSVPLFATLTSSSLVIGHVIVDSGTITAVTAITNALPAGTNNIGMVTPTPTAGQGCTPYHLANGTAASTNSTAIKAAAVGTLCHITALNTTATVYFLKLYDAAAAPTCSSASGLKHVYPIPASTSVGGLSIPMPLGEAYASGIGFCVTGGGTDTDNSNAATGVYIEASYK